MKGKIRHAHLSDFDLDCDCLPPGEGRSMGTSVAPFEAGSLQYGSRIVSRWVSNETAAGKCGFLYRELLKGKMRKG